MRVLVSNSERHNAYEAALALYEADALAKLVTGTYYKRGTPRTKSLEKLLSVAGGSGDLARFRRRRLDGLPDDLVTSIGWPDLVERAWSAMRPLHRLLPAETATYWKNDMFDRRASHRIRGVDAVHAFEQCAEFQLRRAKRIGAVRVLDEPIIFRGLVDRLEAEERDRLGVPSSRPAPGYRTHIDRKFRELELAEYLFTGLEFVRRSYIDSGFPEDRIFLAPYGVDVSTYAPREVAPAGDTFNILYVGQISWWKGLPFLLDVYEQLDIPNAKLTVVGMLHPEWRTYFERRMAKMTRPLNYREKIPHAQMRDELAAADVLVFPSLVGGVGLVTYEAMAAGVPVITSDGDVVIRDGEDGLVAPYGDVAAWSAALSRLAGDRDLRSSLGRAGAERVRSFTWEAYRQGVRDAYGTIAEREGIS
ncbi:MAG: glycosyltransferase family 4 protein [Actinomycetota bacterium]